MSLIFKQKVKTMTTQKEKMEHLLMLHLLMTIYMVFAKGLEKALAEQIWAVSVILLIDCIMRNVQDYDKN